MPWMLLTFICQAREGINRKNYPSHELEIVYSRPLKKVEIQVTFLTSYLPTTDLGTSHLFDNWPLIHQTFDGSDLVTTDLMDF